MICPWPETSAEGELNGRGIRGITTFDAGLDWSLTGFVMYRVRASGAQWLAVDKLLSHHRASNYQRSTQWRL